MSELDPELAALSAALGALAPAAPALDRDRLFFEAGRRAVRPRARAWPFATCGFAALSVALGLRLATAPVPAPVERIVVVSAPASRERERPEEYVQKSPVAYVPGSPAPLTDAPYLRLRDQVLRFGPDALPALPPGAPEPLAPPIRVRGFLDADPLPRWFNPLS
jgi:hypothetical protein